MSAAARRAGRRALAAVILIVAGIFLALPSWICWVVEVGAARGDYWLHRAWDRLERFIRRLWYA